MAKKKPQKRSIALEAMETLIEEQKNKVEEAHDIIELIDLNKINFLKLANDDYMHNRITYSKTKLDELAINISQLSAENSGILGTGILNPLMCRKVGDSYEILHGHNRLKALKKINASSAPVIILKEVNDELARFIRTSENLHREDLNPYDETLSILEHLKIFCPFESLRDARSFIMKTKNYKAGRTTFTENELETYEKVSQVFNKIGRFDAITFSDRLSVLNIHELIKQALVDEYINYSQARVINSQLKDKDDIKSILKLLKSKRMSIKELKTYISEIKANKTQIKSTYFETLPEIPNFKNLIKKTKVNGLDADKQKKLIIQIEELSKIHKKINSLIS